MAIYDFNGKTVLITGGTAGIGLATAKRFGKSGAAVAICGRRESKLQEALEELKKEGIDAFGMTCDVGSTGQFHAFADAAGEKFGHIDILINNAGLMHTRLLTEITEEEFDETINANLKSVFTGCRIAFEKMKDRGGVIINAASFATVIPSVGYGAYAAAKSGVAMLTRSFAAELAPYNIRVVGYIPGVIDTDLTKDMQRINKSALVDALCIKRLGDPEDIAGGIAFLASDDAAYITGTCLEMSAGKFAVQNSNLAYKWAGK